MNYMQAPADPVPPHPETAKVRRMRALLGTFVVIEATAPCVEAAHSAIRAAFATIAELQTLLHPGTARGDLTRIREASPGTPVRVAASTWDLLRLASELSALSEGVFDPSLPHRPGKLRDLELLAEHRILAHVPVALDFGGFAKGHAVDRAIQVLVSHGCRSGLVNAGGDMRAFGADPWPVALRGSDGNFKTFELADAALAVSDSSSQEAPSEHQGYYNRAWPQDGLICTRAAVVAREAVLADALTKCLMLCRQAVAARVLQAFEAFALPLT